MAVGPHWGRSKGRTARSLLRRRSMAAHPDIGARACNTLGPPFSSVAMLPAQEAKPAKGRGVFFFLCWGGGGGVGGGGGGNLLEKDVGQCLSCPCGARTRTLTSGIQATFQAGNGECGDGTRWRRSPARNKDKEKEESVIAHFTRRSALTSSRPAALVLPQQGMAEDKTGRVIYPVAVAG